MNVSTELNAVSLNCLNDICVKLLTIHAVKEDDILFS